MGNFCGYFWGLKFSNFEILRLLKFENLKKLEEEFGFKEAAIGQKTGKKIKFFNLGSDNKWQNILSVDFKNKLNEIFKNDLIKWDYKIND